MHNNLLEQIRALRLGHMSNALELHYSHCCVVNDIIKIPFALKFILFQQFGTFF
ncbi:TPA: hypothetical protein ACIVNQ_000468 [Salmonella enterica subsp. enterica serovar Mississippi]|nr:hypothetical protein [Salmonella enterica subsp. enterica serovar Mississippi]HEC7460862.1 hypothetical protein [Salmonella enterica subsp. enterica serovar Mississippi]